MMNKYILSAAIMAGSFSSASFAQLAGTGLTTDGILESTSTGKIELMLEVDDSIEITGLQEFQYGIFDAADTGDQSISDDFCVYRNGGDGYEYTITSTNGSFVLNGTIADANNGNAIDTIPYVVRVNGAKGVTSSTGTQVTYGQITTVGTFLGSSYRDCSDVSGENASINVNIPEQGIRDATSDDYTDTVIVLVSPV